MSETQKETPEKQQNASREEMVSFLKNHFRYYTMNSWNRSTSFAANVKIRNLGLPSKIEDKAYLIIHQGAVYDEIGECLQMFDEEYNHQYQIGFNGRSGGYLVLYKGGINKDGKIYCRPGQSIGNEDWDDEEYIDDRYVEEMYDLVKRFDATVEECKGILVEFCNKYDVKQETVMIPREVDVLVEREGTSPDQEA